LYRQWIWGYPQPFLSAPLASTIKTGQYTLDVIPTPGHSPDHVVLYERENGSLFSGDLFLATQQVISMSQDSVPQQIASLKQILQLDFDTVFCGHAGPIAKGKQKIAKKLEYLEELQAKVIKLAQTGLNPRQINHQLFPAKPSITYLSQGEWSSLHMVKSICNLNAL
jgi:glyoxylase-like metal-dependent hydrolase (beta-lactamase superfamily II)